MFKYLRPVFIISPVFIPSHPFPFLPLLSPHFSFSHPLYSPGTFTFFNEITLLLARDFIPDYRYRYIYIRVNSLKKCCLFISIINDGTINNELRNNYTCLLNLYLWTVQRDFVRCQFVFLETFRWKIRVKKEIDSRDLLELGRIERNTFIRGL